MRQLTWKEVLTRPFVIMFFVGVAWYVLFAFNRGVLFSYPIAFLLPALALALIYTVKNTEVKCMQCGEIMSKHDAPYHKCR